MADYPVSLDNFVNPTSADTLDNPPHSTQHANLNDAVEALEAKVGIGVSPAGSAVAGDVLTAQGGGTAIWQALPADTSGLVHIETQNPSAVSGVSFNNVFSSNYKSYKIVYSIIPTITTLQFRLRNAGSDVSTSNYFWHAAVTLSSGTGYGTGRNGNGGNSFSFSESNTGTTAHHGFIDITNPGDAINKGLVGMGVTGATADNRGGQFLCGINLASAHDGFSIFVGSGTLSGSISVYGYKK